MNSVLLYDIFRFGHCVLLAGIQTMLMLGIIAEWRREKRAIKLLCPQHVKVSVIIPVHNESRRMEGLLRSLLVQDYPAEIIFVDDRSGDESPAMLARFLQDARSRGMENCRIITLKENPGPNFKQYALGRGIAESSGDYLLFTDGDCQLPSGWIRAMVHRIADGKTGAVIGPVFKKMPGKDFFYLYQCFDHIARYNYLAAAAALGAAGGGFGNNLIISKKALDELGGYSAVPPSPTEDAALISIIRRHGKYKVCAAMHSDAAVETVPEISWKALVNQTLRWNNGGVFSPDPLTRFNFNLLMLLGLTGILAVFLLPFFPSLWPLPLGVLIGMMENTVAAFFLFRTKLPLRGFFSICAYFLALLFTPVYFALMTLMGYFHIRIKWKEKFI